MIKKENKIIVVVDPDQDQRKKLIARIAVEFGFAKTTSDALKIIKSTPYEYDISTSYFILAHTYDFRNSRITTGKLYELAVRGIAVIVGVKRLPVEFEFCCKTFFKEDF